MPYVFTECLSAFGLQCQHDCTGISKDKFLQIISEKYPHLLKKDENRKKIDFVYDLLEKYGIIKNGTVSESDGSIIRSSLIRVRDLHFAGIGSRFFIFVSPKKPTFLDKIWNPILFFDFLRDTSEDQR